MSNNAGGTNADRIVGANIKRRRHELGVTVAEVMQHLGCSTQYVAALEAGEVRPSFDTLAALAILLKCEISLFFASDTSDS